MNFRRRLLIVLNIIIFANFNQIFPLGKRPLEEKKEIESAKDGYLNLKVSLDGSILNGKNYPEAYFLVTRNQFNVGGGGFSEQGTASIFLSSGSYLVQAVVEKNRQLVAREKRDIIFKTTAQWVIFDLKSKK